MTYKAIYNDFLKRTKAELKDCTIDHKSGLYIAVNNNDNDTGYIIQGYDYDNFIDTVQKIYEKDTHSYADCIMIALEPYNILLHG
jgi:hypothetical protein